MKRKVKPIDYDHIGRFIVILMIEQIIQLLCIIFKTLVVLFSTFYLMVIEPLFLISIVYIILGDNGRIIVLKGDIVFIISFIVMTLINMFYVFSLPKGNSLYGLIPFSYHIKNNIKRVWKETKTKEQIKTQYTYNIPMDNRFKTFQVSYPLEYYEKLENDFYEAEKEWKRITKGD